MFTISGSKFGLGFLTGVFHAVNIFTMFLLKVKHIPEVLKLFRIVSLFLECLLGLHDLNWKFWDTTSRNLISPFRKLKQYLVTWTISHADITVITVTENSIYDRAYNKQEGDVKSCKHFPSLSASKPEPEKYNLGFLEKLAASFNGTHRNKSFGFARRKVSFCC